VPVTITNPFNRRKHADTPTLTPDNGRLRKRDEARISLLQEERDQLQRQIDAGRVSGQSEQVYAGYVTREVERFVQIGPETHVVKEQIEERTYREATPEGEHVAALDREITAIRRSMDEREAKAAADAIRAELRRTDLPRETADLKADVAAFGERLLPIMEEARALERRADAMAAKYGWNVAGHELGVPEVCRLVRGRFSPGELLSGSNSGFRLWFDLLKEFGIKLTGKSKVA
jgi:hypothetical protein